MDETTAATSEVESTTADAAQEAGVVASEAADTSSGDLSPATEPVESGQDTAAAPTDAATARSHGLIAEHFGLDAAVLADASPALLAALESQAEKALLDQFRSQKTPEDQATKPAEQPETAVPGDFKPDFTPFVTQFAETFGEEEAKPFKAALDYVAGEFSKQLAPLRAMQQAFQPIAETWHEQTTAEHNRRIDGFFGDLLKNEPAWKDMYTGPKGDKAKSDVVEFAVQLKQAAAQRGQQLTGEQALKRAHLALSKEFTAAQAISALRSKVEKRSKNITTPPGMTGGKHVEQPDGDDLRTRMLRDIAPKYEALQAETGVR